MGKLTLDQKDLQKLVKSFLKPDVDLAVNKNEITFQQKDLKVVVSQLGVCASIDKANQSYEVTAKYEQGDLKVDFE